MSVKTLRILKEKVHANAGYFNLLAVIESQ